MATIVINPTTHGVFQYSGTLWDAALAAVSCDNRLLVMLEDGLYESIGDDDASADIDCHVLTGKIDFGAPASEKQLHHLWVVLASLDDVEVTLYPSSWKGQETLGPWDATAVSVPINSGEPYNRIVRGLLGQPGLYWQIKIANKDGGAFDIEAFYAVAEQTRVLL